jgi:hypothetical protein
MGTGGAAPYNDAMRHEDITQYSVVFDDGGRRLGRLSRLLAGEKICRKSLVTARSRGRAVAQFLARHSAGLREKLERLGGSVREDQIFQVELEGLPQLQRLTRALADAGINILSLYTEEDGGRLRAVMAADETANAVELAAKLGMRPDYHVFELRA